MMFKTKEERAKIVKDRAKAERERKKALTPEEREKEKLAKARKKEDEYWRKKNIKDAKLADKKFNSEKKRELKLLKFMLKTDVLYHHHGKQDSSVKTIKSRIERIKERNKYTEYDPYGWNWDLSYPGLSLLGCIWSSSFFESIYDVPLDGSYIFYIYDSGERGSGSKNRMTAKKVDVAPYVPYVNPGAIIPITAS